MTVSILSSGVHYFPDRETGPAGTGSSEGIIQPDCVAGEFFEIAAKRASPLTRWRPVSANFRG
jgi:hypothetical protein